ncbi:late secretory pathway protein AVL9 homolog isoform X2 [Artemia franciscana]|uniref:late secretory pathway protein AVL9 homolog isoform X2 n=1 Tax=Artemia franciscana TaxID=6661 RepID=UPI0032DA7CC4
MASGASPILHIVVVGFNHLKGWQVEYSYPAFKDDEVSSFCPEKWKYLSHLAIPDGSHNYDEDTVYFHLPSLDSDDRTVFAVGCYRQVAAAGVKNKAADVTRRTIQKSIVVLSSLPLYDRIEVKLSLVATAYCAQNDFAEYGILKEAYGNLRNCLTYPLPLKSYGASLSLPEVLCDFYHETLTLLKLILLEKRVLIFGSPVKPMCRALLTLVSVFPGTLEKGLDYCISTLKTPPCHPELDLEHFSLPSENLNADYLDVDAGCNNGDEDTGLPLSVSGSSSEIMGSQNSIVSAALTKGLSDSESSNKATSRISLFETKLGSAVWGSDLGKEAETSVTSPSPSPSNLTDEECGFPLRIFGEGYLFHPFVSLSNMEVLTEREVYGFVAGTSNALLIEKKELFDVQIEFASHRLTISDAELRKQLRLTTEDLRFLDNLVRVNSSEKQDYIEGVGWQGGEEWMRSQFRNYIVQLLRATQLPESTRENECFNPHFLQAFKKTKIYSRWMENAQLDILKLQPLHPGCGHMSVSDVKLRLSHTISTTESGRKLSFAAVTTGKAVAQTGKAVGMIILNQ